MRVIFLDIDGVLTTCSYHNPDTNHIDPRRVWILTQLIKDSPASKR